jgi:hypothetical protein
MGVAGDSRGPWGQRLLRLLGWGSTMVLVPAADLQAFRHWRPDRGVADPDGLSTKVLFLVGTIGQAAYGKSHRDRVLSRSSVCLAGVQLAGLGGAA